MVTVSEATDIVNGNLYKPGIGEVVVEESAGRILAEPVLADRDFPPFNRVSMDGIAFSYREWKSGRRTFKIEGTQAAGEPGQGLVDSADCIEVMTGAVLPPGCDTVVRYEDLDVANGIATVKTVMTQWQSVHVQGVDAKKGERILDAGQMLAPSEVALLASVGKGTVRVFTWPKVAIISTGDELVGIDDNPAPWQIRRSNAYSIQSALREMSVSSECFHLRDEATAMTESIRDLVRDFDVLILSGGVSRGKFDFVPQALEGVGIRRLFHQVSQRPGKPFWFGRSAAGTTAFALPGNPVSTFMCFYRYVRPWILKSMSTAVRTDAAILGRDFSFAPALTFFLQVSVRNEAGRRVAYPVPGGGSGDFANLKNVDGFLELPAEQSDFKAGEVFPYIAFRH